MNPEHTPDEQEEYLFSMMEAEYEFLGKRLEEFKAWRKAKNEQYAKSIEGDTDSATEFGMDYQRKAQNQ